MLRRTGFKSKKVDSIGFNAGLKRSPFKKKSVKRRTGYSNPEYMARVAALGCAICRRLGLGWVPAEVHHQRTGTGGGVRAPDTKTAPLCNNHHTGADGIHQGRKKWEKRFEVTELELVAETQLMLGFKEEAQSYVEN